MRTSTQVKQDIKAQVARVSLLRKEIAEIQKPFLERMSAAMQTKEEEIERINKTLSDLRTEYNNLLTVENKTEWNTKTPTTPDEFRRWLWDSGKSPFADRVHGESIRPTFLPNGVRVFCMMFYEWKNYVAFKGNDIVGYMFLHVSQHPGDQTQVWVANVFGKSILQQGTIDIMQWVHKKTGEVWYPDMHDGENAPPNEDRDWPYGSEEENSTKQWKQIKIGEKKYDINILDKPFRTFVEALKA